ncbi:type VI secretion protein [Providencia rettgeri]|uniref:type VI secretion protein n=1 Tax=Providencia rettgeri TaxID=587 RepID=UPI00141A4804|nr:type VI secretion protein [Providencia rettgeri]NIH07054.1 type VI secretion protein [Providencia rettgeri]
MRKNIKAVVLAAFLSVSTAQAGGILTFDATSALNQVREMVQDLNNYAEYIETTALNNNQLIEAYKQYDQMLADYQQTLKEAMALKDKIEGMDPDYFLQKLAEIANAHDPLFSEDGGKIATNTGNQAWDDAYERNKILTGYGLTDDEYNEMLAKIPFGGDERQRAQEMFEYRQKRVAQGIAKDAYVIELQNNIKEQSDETLFKLKKRRLEQGDNSLTASVQFLAEQNEQLLYQINALQAQQAEAMKYNDRLADHYFNNMAAAEERNARQKVKEFNK